MIRKILSPVNQAITHIQDWADEKLRHLCGRMTPEIRLAVILLMSCSSAAYPFTSRYHLFTG